MKGAEVWGVECDNDPGVNARSDGGVGCDEDLSVQWGVFSLRVHSVRCLRRDSQSDMVKVDVSIFSFRAAGSSSVASAQQM